MSFVHTLAPSAPCSNEGIWSMNTIKYKTVLSILKPIGIAFVGLVVFGVIYANLQDDAGHGYVKEALAFSRQSKTYCAQHPAGVLNYKKGYIRDSQRATCMDSAGFPV